LTEPTPAPAATDDGGTPPADNQPKPTETVDYWKQRSRENEAKAKANAAAAQRLAEIEEQQKTAEQKQAERLAQLEQEAGAARAEALRLRVATKFGIDSDDVDLFLTSTDEATLTRQAERLSAREADRKKNGNHVPREGTTPTSSDDPRRAFLREVMGR